MASEKAGGGPPRTAMPAEYVGREQSYLKHRVLKEYLLRWGIKVGSLSRRGPVRLCYVDCFSGPWRSKSQRLDDTSIHIGLTALSEAAAVWREQGNSVSVRALFVEKDRRAFEQLRDYLQGYEGPVETTPFHGEFGDRVDELAQLVGRDPAFVFVDPTGFKGAAMRHIAALTGPRMRDVLVNVMINDINRFKNDQRDFLREHFRDFFGDELPPGLDEAGLMELYRQNLKQKCGLTYAADLAIPHQTHERTWFRLAVGGKDPTVLDVFRDVEAQVMGREAALVRTAAKQRDAEDRTRQLALGLDCSPEQDPWYEQANRGGRAAAMRALEDLVQASGRISFAEAWPAVLEQHHVTRAELAALALESVRSGRLSLESTRSVRSIKDVDVLTKIRARGQVDGDH